MNRIALSLVNTLRGILSPSVRRSDAKGITHFHFVVKAPVGVFIGLLVAFAPVSSAQAQTFIDSPTTLNTPVVGDVLVGQNNISPFTVRVENGADIPGDGNFSNDGHLGLVAYHQATLAMTGGDVAYLSLFDSSHLEMSGGDISDTLSMHGMSEASVSGVSIARWVDWGGMATVHNSSIKELYVNGRENRADIFSGDIPVLWATDRAVVNIYGGDFSDLSAYSVGHINLSGGDLTNAAITMAENDASISVYGVNLALTGARQGNFRGFNGIYWNLTGTLKSGQDVNATYFERGTNLLQPPVQITLVTAALEPSALALILPGVLMGAGIVCRRGRKG